MAYPKKAKEKADIKSETVKEFSRFESERGDGGVILRVGIWTVNGKPGQPVFEKRDFWKTETEELNVGKARGFGGREIKTLLENLPEIASLLKIPWAEVKDAVEKGMSKSSEKPMTWAECQAKSGTPVLQPTTTKAEDPWG